MLRSSGIDFARLRTEQAIPHHLFASTLMGSGLLCNPRLVWVTFGGGVDFGYIMGLFEPLPADQVRFFERLNAYFVNYFDLKEMKRELIAGGLERTIAYCNLQRIGTMHQAGSDSYMTVAAYFSLMARLISNRLVDTPEDMMSVYNQRLYGLGHSENTEPYIEEQRQHVIQNQFNLHMQLQQHQLQHMMYTNQMHP